MLKNITLEKPLAVIDLETTGIDVKADRIVEISVLKIMPDGQRIQRTRRVNPGISIPAEATAVHGITDADVADEPRFEKLAGSLLKFLDGCGLCGFNLKKFDLRVLYNEFKRTGRTLSLEGRAIIDPMEIFHHFEPRDLAAAVRKHLGHDHDGAHSAAADVLATVEVLDAMVSNYPGLPRSVDGLHEHFSDDDRIGSDGFFQCFRGEIRFLKGKHRGLALAVVAASAPDYLEWMMAQDFFDDTKAVVREALTGARPIRNAARDPS